MKVKSGALIFAIFVGSVFVLLLASASSRAAAPTSGGDSLNGSRPYDVPTVVPGEWPMYGHDVQRTNFNPDETAIDPSTINLLTQAWQQDIAPAGRTGTAPSSAPSVSGGKVFVGSNATSGSNFWAFDATTGSLAWSDSLTYTNRCFNVGIGSTAAISGTILSVGGSDSAFYGINADTGQIVWRNPMNAGLTAFPWESPLLANDRSYLGIASDCDNPSVRGEVRAVDLYSGTQLANQYFVPAGQAGAGVWNSPALSPDGTKLIAATGEDYGGYNGPYNRAIVALDPISLAILSSFQEGALGQDLDFGTTPVIFHDSQGRTLVGANHKNGVFYTFDINNINSGPIWTKGTGTTVGMMPAYDPTFGSGGTLFIAGSGGNLYAVDPATGVDRPGWNPGALNYHGNLAIANGLVFVNGGSSGLKILDENTGAVLRTLTPSNLGSANSGVVVSNGFIYWQAGHYLNAWHIEGTPGPTNTPTSTSTSTPTFTHTVTNTPTASNTPTPTLTNTSTVSATSSPTETATTQPTETGTTQPTDTPGTTETATVQPTDTPIPGTTETPAATKTSTSVATATESTGTPAATSTPTGTTTVATATVVSTVTITPTPCANSFTDVNSGDYFYDAVLYLSCHGAVSGYADNTFRPYNNTTRGQLSKIVVLAEGWQINTSGGPHFTDVLTDNPFYPYIETAYHRQVISGYDDRTFRWGNNITRGQLTKVMVLSEGWAVNPPSTPTFTDVPTTHPFYSYIETAYSHGVLSGYADHTFRPQNDATRGQIAKIVYNAVITSSMSR